MKRWGLTLAEFVLALGLMAILLVMVGGLMTRLVAASNKSGDLSAGMELAQRVLNDVVLRGTYDTSQALTTYTLYSHNDQVVTEFTYQVTSTPVAVPDSPPSYFVVVDTWWWGAGATHDSRANMGKLHARLSRLVSP
ncbi:hypothetical protein JST97_17265 [bacterium]|nr:hypothetical protein [bacterium]